MASDTELWRGTDYGWWLAADTSGAVGASLIAFAVPLIMLATTGSSAAATTTESICVVVQTVLGLAGGVIQDRYDRRTLMLIWGCVRCGALGGGGGSGDAVRQCAEDERPWG